MWMLVEGVLGEISKSCTCEFLCNFSIYFHNLSDKEKKQS